MEAPTSAHRRLASAYLALSDDPVPPATQRSVPRVLGAVASAIVIALAGPLAWASAATGRPSADQPAATAAAKGALPGPEADDGDGDGGDGPPLGGGHTWAGTNA